MVKFKNKIKFKKKRKKKGKKIKVLLPSKEKKEMICYFSEFCDAYDD